jgi:hypothetical protein
VRARAGGGAHHRGAGARRLIIFWQNLPKKAQNIILSKQEALWIGLFLMDFSSFIYFSIYYSEGRALKLS